MLVENKYFECEECGEYCIRLIFAPNSRTDCELMAFTEMLRSDFEHEFCEVWVIGPPENNHDEDCGHLTMQVWPIQGEPKSIPASVFNKRIVDREERHCHTADQSL